MENKLLRSQGCLLGLAVGDAMGYTVDKKSWEEICRDYGPNGLLGYDLQNDYADITSYTQLAAFACNGLLVSATKGQANTYSRYLALSLREWAKSQQFRTAAERTHCWIAQLPALRRRFCMDTRMLDILNRETLGTPEAPSNSSDSPAALTVAAAVGMFFDPERMEPDQVGRLGAEAVAMLCGDEETVLSGAFLAYAIAGILQDPSHTLLEHFHQALDAVLSQFGNQFSQTVEYFAARLNAAISLTLEPELTPLAAMTILGCTTAPECLAGAVYASLVHCGNFDEAMISAVNHSGRSAAVASLAGAFLGAMLGADALPDFYLESLEPLDALRQLAEDMTQRRQMGRIFDDSWDQKYIQGLPV